MENPNHMENIFLWEGYISFQL